MIVQLFKASRSQLWRATLAGVLGAILLIGSAGSAIAQDSTKKGLTPKYTHIWLPDEATKVAGEIDAMFYDILWLTSVVFVLVFVVMIYFLIRYRSRPGGKAIYNHGNTRLEIIWTIIPALIVLFLGFYSKSLWSQIKQDAPTGSDVLVIDVKPRQFQWDIIYSGADGKFGTPDDITAINQMHVPVGHPVSLNLTAQDVIHSFFVPEFRVKQDAVPGMVTRYWFTAEKIGEYEIACAELCGLGHYRMRGYVIVMSQADFDKWYTEQKKAKAAELAPPPAAAPTAAAAPAADTATTSQGVTDSTAATATTSSSDSATSAAPAAGSADTAKGTSTK